MAIYVLTGEIGSGKTTALFNEIKGQINIGGFLSPFRNQIRQFYFIRNGLYMPMEQLGEHYNTDLVVGKYIFDSKAFNLAKVQFALDWDSSLDLLVLDEFGPLEFKNQGLLPELNPYLKAAQENTKQNMLIVVRNTLMESFAKLYAVNQIIYKEDVSDFFRKVLG
ncbi:MAG: nucleoside-triphosphatase [Saprospiraceae bacterium]|jgi:nucleoside-triphosphatase THEP1